MTYCTFPWHVLNTAIYFQFPDSFSHSPTFLTLSATFLSTTFPGFALCLYFYILAHEYVAINRPIDMQCLYIYIYIYIWYNIYIYVCVYILGLIIHVGRATEGGKRRCIHGKAGITRYREGPIMPDTVYMVAKLWGYNATNSADSTVLGIRRGE